VGGGNIPQGAKFRSLQSKESIRQREEEVKRVRVKDLVGRLDGCRDWGSFFIYVQEGK